MKLPKADDLIRVAKENVNTGVFVVGSNPPAAEFLVVVGGGDARPPQFCSGPFVFIKDGGAGEFKGEKDVVSLGKWIVEEHLTARIAAI